MFMFICVSKEIRRAEHEYMNIHPLPNYRSRSSSYGPTSSTAARTFSCTLHEIFVIFYTEMPYNLFFENSKLNCKSSCAAS